MTFNTTNRRRRRPAASTTLFLLTLAASAWAGEAFGLRRWASRRLTSNRNRMERFADQKETNSWSKSAGRSSPLQVRKRVKAVLEKAKTRTGIDNNSSTRPFSVVADAASIGGLVDDDLVLNMNGERNGKSFPDEAWEVGKASNASNVDVKPRKPEDFDVIRGDVPAATMFCEPLPFQLPKLTAEQKLKLKNGERLQEQSRMGREGSGYVILDVHAPPYVVWECLLDFESYPDIIPTVREMQLYTSEKLNIGYVNEKPVLPGTGHETRHYGIPSITRAKFVLSKFRLNIAAVHKYTPHPDGDYMIFTLDKSCTNMVLKGAKGIWHVVKNPDGMEGVSRVYLLCEVQISRALPSFIVDYAAERAMPRATTWLRPQVEAAAELWLKKPTS